MICLNIVRFKRDISDYFIAGNGKAWTTSVKK